MKLEFLSEPLAQVLSPVLVAYSFEDAAASSGTVERLPAEVRGLLEELQTSRELTGKSFECTLVHRPAGLSAQKLLVVGAGKKQKFDDAQLRRVAGTAVRHLRGRGIHNLGWVLEGDGVRLESVQAVVEGAILGDYDADRYRTEREAERRIDCLALATGGSAPSAAACAGLERGRIIAEAQNFTRDLVNEPSNRMTPTILAEHAQEMVKRYGLECQVLGPQEIRDLKLRLGMAVTPTMPQAEETPSQPVEPDEEPSPEILEAPPTPQEPISDVWGEDPDDFSFAEGVK